MLRPVDLRSEIQNDRTAVRRESKLTFAVIWDPDTGMQSFSGDSLDVLKNYQKGENSTAQEDFITRRNANTKPCTTMERPSTPGPEPFAVLGAARAPHFIGIHTVGVYEKYLKGLIPFKNHRAAARANDPSNDVGKTFENLDDEYRFRVNSVLFSDSDSLLTELDQTEIRYYHNLDDSPLDCPPEHSVNVPFTPNSVFTFAALWDPKKGFSTLQDGKLVHVSTCDSQPDVSEFDVTIEGSSGKGDDGHEFDGIQEVIYFPRTDLAAPHREAIPSSTFDGQKGPWNGHPYCEEDEGFYETLPGYVDCDQHLPSRFSISTTSTSRYIQVDDTIVPSPGPNVLAFMGRKPSKGFTAFQRPPRTNGGSLPGRVNLRHTRSEATASSAFKNAPIPTRLSQVFKTRFAKRPRDDIDHKWVLVDVKSVVTERVLEL